MRRPPKENSVRLIRVCAGPIASAGTTSARAPRRAVSKCLVALLFVFFPALPAPADDLDDRVKAAAARMASDDAAERDAGQKDLMALGEEAEEKIAELAASHEDPEVRGRAAAVLRALGLFGDREKDRRCRELLKAISDSEPGSKGRSDLFRELFDLGPAAVSIIAAEFAEAKAEAVPAPTRAAAPGTAAVISLAMKNTGNRALWFHPATVLQTPQLQPFGSLPPAGKFGFVIGGRPMVWRREDENPDDAILRLVLEMKRVPPGDTFIVSTLRVSELRCGLASAGLVVRKTALAVTGSIRGESLTFPPALPESLPGGSVALLAGRTATGFTGKIVRDGDAWALELTATEDIPERPADARSDAFWWAATGDNGAFLGSGPLRGNGDAVPAWKKDEIRRFPFKSRLPFGARRLWLGFEGMRQGAQVVPPSVEAR